MASFTPEVVRATLERLPDQYTDLAACFMTVVHDLSTGDSDRYQEKVAQLVDGYFVLMLETFRSTSDGILGTPGILRVLMHQSVSESGTLGSIPHIAQLVEVVFEHFEARLWSLMVESFSEVTILPDRGPCDLFVPVFGIFMKDLVGEVSFDDVPTLKASTRHVLGKVPVSDFHRAIIQFIEQMTSMIADKPHRATHKVRDELIAFILVFRSHVSPSEQIRLSEFIKLLSGGAVTPLPKRRPSHLN
jgi:hypothetical protein